MSWPEFYILVDRLPVAVDVLTWGKWFGANERHVGDDKIGNVRVSTVFLGLNHRFPRSSTDEPLLFETLVFGGPLDGEMDRYSTWAEAERGHAEVVVKVRKAAAQIKAIKDNVR